MAGFGGLSPLPIRLGGRDSETNWTAADHAAMCRDLAAVARVTPFAHMTIWRNGTEASIVDYRGINGSSIDDGPSISLDTYTIRLVFPAEWTDGLGYRRSIKVLSAVAVPANDPQVVDIGAVSCIIDTDSGRSRVSVGTMSGNGYARVTVWGSYLDDVTIEDYGGSLDKEDTSTEVTPYSWSLLQMLRDARGSAYTRERGGLVHVENLALARAQSATWRRSERLASNSNPATALEAAEDWRSVLGVRRRDGDTPEKIRTRNAVKMRAALGPTRQTVDDAIAELMGPLYVRTWRNYDPLTIADDNTGTFWPTVNPGTPSRDLGGGAWYSDRQHVVVELTRPAFVDELEWSEKIADLVEFLDLTLPATCTFDWCTGADDGFTLDEDLLDEGCLGS